MKRQLVGRVVAVVFLVAATMLTIQAQAPTGTINGIVTDPHQAVVSWRARIGHRTRHRSDARDSFQWQRRVLDPQSPYRCV